MQFHVQNYIIVIYIQYRVRVTPSIGYLVMAEDGKTDERTKTPDRQELCNQSAITPL